MLTLPRRIVADRLAPGAAGRRTAADLELDTLTGALGLEPGALVRVDVVEVDHGTSQRSRLLLGHADGGTTRVFVKNSPVKLGPAVLDGLAKLCERESAFYRDIAPGIPAAPRAHLSEWDARTGRSTLVLPDLVGLGFEFRPLAEPCTVEQAALVVDAVAAVHTAAPERTGVADDPLFTLDNASMRRLNRLVCRRLGRAPKSLAGLVPHDVLAESRVLATHAREVADVLASYPETFVHNDTHRGNIGFAPDRAALVDWQYCGWGPMVKDVAYFLATSLDPADRRRHERELFDRYTDRMRAAGRLSMTPDEAWSAYRVLTVTAYIAATVTALFGSRLQSTANTEQGVHRACAAVRDLDSFTALRDRLATLPSNQP